MANQTGGFDKIVSFFAEHLFFQLNIINLLSLGVILGFVSLWLNFLILKQIRKKIIFLGMTLQNKIREKYLALGIDFSQERDSKIDLKVFSESILVVAESIFLQLYLAFTRVIIILIYAVVGVYIIGWHFLLICGFLGLIFGLSFLIFAIRIRNFTNLINLIGERRLRVLSNFVLGRVDIFFFKVPTTMIHKMDNLLRELLFSKITVMTEVHKPRIVIEGTLILILISLGFLRINFPNLYLNATEILSILLVLRLLPALQQFTSNIRGATSSAWALKDIKELLKTNDKNLGDLKENPWTCEIELRSKAEEWIIINVRNNFSKKMAPISFKPGKVNIIKGPSGVGKSSLLKAIIESLQKHEEWENKLKKMTSFLPQDPVSFLVPFEENIFMGRPVNFKHLEDNAKTLDFTSEWIKLFDKSVKDDLMIVSGGESQRIAFLRCFLNPDKEILILDEPTSALDKSLEKKVTGYIEARAKQGALVVIVTHSELSINENTIIINL